MIHQNFAIVRMKSGKEHLVATNAGERALGAWMAPVADLLVSHDLKKLSGSKVQILIDEIESIEQLNIGQAVGERELEVLLGLKSKDQL